MSTHHPLIPHHDGSPLYVSTQTPALGDAVRVRVRVPEAFGPVLTVHTRSNPDHEPRYQVASHVANLDGWDWWEAEIEIENPVHRYRFLFELDDHRILWLNATGLHSIETLDSEDFRLVTWPSAPEWASGTVLYQVFPDRFARSAQADAHELPAWAVPAAWGDDVISVGADTPRQFYGGDLPGVEEHLDHLERLGVTMIYLTPVFPAQSNHRYDALSFDEVDPLLGGDDALVSLVTAAHERGLRVMGDLTTNHSGDAHEWFRASHLNPGAPESEFYYWLDSEQRHYVSWLGVPSLPKFNWNSYELRRRFIHGVGSVVSKWLRPPYSLDGWRIDVSNMTGRYLDQDLNQQVRRIIRDTMVDANPDTILLGESTNDAAPDFDGDSWHGAMTYANFTRPIWAWLSEPGSPATGGIGMALGMVPTYTGEEVYQAHLRFTAAFPWRVRLHNMNALDTHDTPRFLTHARPGTVPVAFGLAVTLPGIPVVFAGDEFGLTGDDGEHSRTPIPWDAVDSSAETIDLYAELIHLRTGHPVLSDGGIRWLHVGAEVLVLVRESSGESVLVVAARSGFSLTLPADAVAGSPERLYGESVMARVSADGIALSAAGPSFAAFALPGVTLPDFADVGTVLALE
jgi:alpha-glucosidase